eukprot:COSAG01_NODE_54423_length_332_cov_0.660944_1_plen_48_part_10
MRTHTIYSLRTVAQQAWLVVRTLLAECGDRVEILRNGLSTGCLRKSRF